MTIKEFSKSAAVNFCWLTLKNNSFFFIGLFIITVAIAAILKIIGTSLAVKNFPIIFIIINSIYFILNLIIDLGLNKIALNFCDGGKSEFTDLFSQYHLFFNYLSGLILYGLIIIGGTTLLIVPGIICAIKFYFFGYSIVDKGLGPIESLKRSSAITEGAKWSLFPFWLLLVGIHLLGGTLLVARVWLPTATEGSINLPFTFIQWTALFIKIPTTLMAAFVYRKLLSQVEVT